jgi:hypothetical protein
MIAVSKSLDEPTGETYMTKWHDHTWTFTASILGSPIELKKSPPPNSFKLVPKRDADEKIYLYTIEPLIPNCIAAAWAECRLLPQGGLPLTKAVPPASKLDPSKPDFKTALEALVKDIKANRIPDLSFCFERLVGTFPGNTFDNPVAFYQVANVFTDPTQLLLIVDPDLISASPGGTVAGHN